MAIFRAPNVWSAKCPGAKCPRAPIFQGANCPYSQMSRSQMSWVPIVQSANCPGAKCPKRQMSGAKCPGAGWRAPFVSLPAGLSSSEEAISKMWFSLLLSDSLAAPPAGLGIPPQRSGSFRGSVRHRPPSSPLNGKESILYLPFLVTPPTRPNTEWRIVITVWT